ncbi:MAG: NAD(+)/NADH kinase [Actinomycetota bacterium]|nr:NAD(+)/NADH kinase [Actinomycetota bacterium]
MTHGKREVIGSGLERLQRVAAEAGVELLLPDDEREKHGVGDGAGPIDDADLAVVLGGDGTMLRALNRFLGTSVPVIGVNFGRVGFLSTVRADELDSALARAFAGDYEVVELPTLVAETGGRRQSAVNDVVARSADVGRMVELGWALGGEDLGAQPCDGIICAAPGGSTAYNLSNGGPVLVWGLEAMAVTFVAPHSLHARPVVVPKGLELAVENRTPDVAVMVILDGHTFAELAPGGAVSIRLDERRTLLATLPEATFFRRYREIFGS